MKTFTRRAALFGAGAIFGGWLTHHFTSTNPSLDGTATIAGAGGEGKLNDASGLSETPIFRHSILTEDPGDALVKAIRAEIADARAEERPVNVGAARHSMGGQAIPHDGHALTFDSAWIEPDIGNSTMLVHAGARWHQVISALDPLGFGPRVMQSNNDFGVAATFCVNAHGWPVKIGPMGASVRSFDMVLPDGGLVSCSRTENPGLFGMTMGGYGLTGAITRMEVDIAPNQRLAPTFEKLDSRDFGQRFTEALDDTSVTMAYGRLNVDRAHFFDQALLITYRATEDQSALPPASGSGTLSKLSRQIYRAQLGNERMKRIRWWTETDLGPKLGGGPSTRNSLINEPVVTLDDRDPNRTDILHEYFVPPDRFADFIDVCRQVIPASYQEFLNVTLRYVDTDPDSWLAYAPQPRIAAVMSFSQEMTARAEADMKRMTQALIEGILGVGGTYYLPYRPHARQEQFVHAYPRAAEFAKAKRELDPQGIFRNNFWDTYMETL
ncbi:FAD-binding oxidoreductase [Pseudoruegeria sp. HB172150]|uniref:FAD-binding oxidoreductase n=1 Tax=Pseudoruegeria sp. HB172150 TaxID=2721164 RepID=UPI001557A63B|nr:FAD-binding oxidoreductase [Pseudoruegeria sp. HB172150]